MAAASLFSLLSPLALHVSPTISRPWNVSATDPSRALGLCFVTHNLATERALTLTISRQHGCLRCLPADGCFSIAGTHIAHHGLPVGG